MEETSTSSDEMTPKESVYEYLRQNPFKLSPWAIRNFFSDSDNMEEQQLEYSLDALAELEPQFTEDHSELLEELEKWALMAVPMIRKIPISVLLQMIDEYQGSLRILPLLPDFPKAPATKILDFVIEDKSLGEEKREEEYKKIIKDTRKLLGYVGKWRDSMAEYVDTLGTFMADNEGMSAQQIRRTKLMMDNSKSLSVQIDTKYEGLKEKAEREEKEFERFYRVVVKEAQYSEIEPAAARSQIQVVYNDTDPTVRSIVAGTYNEEEDEIEEDDDETEKEEEEETVPEVQVPPKRQSSAKKTISS